MSEEVSKDKAFFYIHSNFSNLSDVFKHLYFKSFDFTIGFLLTSPPLLLLFHSYSYASSVSTNILSAKFAMLFGLRSSKEYSSIIS